MDNREVMIRSTLLPTYFYTDRLPKLLTPTHLWLMRQLQLMFNNHYKLLNTPIGHRKTERQ